MVAWRPHVQAEELELLEGLSGQMERSTYLPLSAALSTWQSRNNTCHFWPCIRRISWSWNLRLIFRKRSLEMWGSFWPSILQEETHQIRPIHGETSTTPGMKSRDLPAKRSEQVETDALKSLITPHWSTFMLVSPGKSSNRDPQPASRAREWIDRSASSLEWSQGTCPLRESKEMGNRGPPKQANSPQWI